MAWVVGDNVAIRRAWENEDGVIDDLSPTVEFVRVVGESLEYLQADGTFSTTQHRFSMTWNSDTAEYVYFLTVPSTMAGHEIDATAYPGRSGQPNLSESHRVTETSIDDVLDTADGLQF